MTKVTVLTPIFNNKADIQASINSMLNQTHQDWEMIILDDGSTDGLRDSEFVKNIADPRIRFVWFTENRGVYVCLNEGLKRATGHYVTRLDSDDTFDNKKLEKQVRILDHDANIQVVQCKYQREQGRSNFGEVTLMYRRAIIDKIGYYDSVRFGADTEFLFRVAKVFGHSSIHKLDEILYYAKLRQNSLTTSKATGFSPHGRKIRGDYMAAFKQWHQRVAHPYIDYPMVKRPFPVSIDMIVKK